MKVLNADIKSGEFHSVYLLYGEEDYLKNQYKKNLRKAILPEDDTMNFTLFEGKGIDPGEIIEQAETLPFFAEHRLIQVEDSGFFRSASPELSDYLPRMPKESILLFVESQVDRRGKLFRTVQSLGYATELKRQDEKTLSTWVLGRVRREGKKITKDALDLFLTDTGDDMEKIDTELNKLLSYTLDEEAITRERVEEVCSPGTEDRIFDMVRAVAGRDQKRALDLYYDLLALKEAPLRILYQLGRQFNQLLEMKDLRSQGLNDAAIGDRMHLSPYIIKRNLKETAGLDEKKLISAVKDCVESEEDIKTGRADERLAVEMLIVKYSQSTN